LRFIVLCSLVVSVGSGHGGLRRASGGCAGLPGRHLLEASNEL
jgi:hypothetical protein